jgi:hypothetical protein
MAARGVKWAIAAALGAGLLFPAAGHGVVTIGSNLGRTPTAATTPNLTVRNRALPSSYLTPGGLTSPVNGAVTLWRIRSGDTGGFTSFQVVKPLGGNLFTGAGTTDVFPVPADAITSFAPASLPISIGDSIGVRNDAAFGGLKFFSTDPQASSDFWAPALQDGAPGRAPIGPPAPIELTINADISPTNAFTVGVTSRNKRKGTATITANLPNAGELIASGQGVKAAGVAAISKTVTAPGAATLVIRAKGKKKAKLNDTGKVKLKPTITFTPTGGTASTLSTKVKLKKNL